MSQQLEHICSVYGAVFPHPGRVEHSEADVMGVQIPHVCCVYGAVFPLEVDKINADDPIPPQVIVNLVHDDSVLVVDDQGTQLTVINEV